jgi:hypothetical protein
VWVSGCTPPAPSGRGMQCHRIACMHASAVDLAAMSTFPQVVANINMALPCLACRQCSAIYGTRFRRTLHTRGYHWFPRFCSA